MTNKSTKRIGDITELELCHYFLDQGLEVYRNVSSTGPVDFITLDTESGEVTLYDSKTGSVRKNAKGESVVHVGYLSDIQNKLGVKLVAKYDGRILNEEKVIL